MENWAPVQGYETLYEVSDLGKVRRIPQTAINVKGVKRYVAGRELVPQYNKCSNYRYVSLWKHNKCKKFDICVLVAQAFMSGYDPNLPIYHSNMDCNDDCIHNLTQMLPKLHNPYYGLVDDCPYEDELWKPVPNFETIYEVSNYGRIRILARYKRDSHGTYSLCRCKIATHNSEHIRYHRQVFVDPDKNIKEVWQIHRLVATLFVPNPDPTKYTVVNHLDANKHNNVASNLEWVTAKENAEHAANMGLLSWERTSRGHTTPVHCITDNTYYPSIASAARRYSIDYSRLQCSLHNGSGVVQGVEFEYIK